MYQVLARRWRPQTFDQLVGQPHVRQSLVNAVEADRLAHAYIFAGMRGTGKTTVARVLAKCLNCEKGPTATPCSACPPCVEIAESRSMDVLEIDAASRTKVDQTRELLEVVTYAPVRDRYKILIVDEAHMLSKASFNALLKTLEEPPPNVVFVLATTELHRILPTILSRCQVFEFRRVSAREVAAHLRRICDEEKIAIPDAALERLARAGEGSVRDSISLLERAVALCGTQIEDEGVMRLLGAVQADVLAALLAALARRDASAMLRAFDRLLDEGHDLLHFWTALIAAVRDLLLLRTLPDREELLSRPAGEASLLASAAAELSVEDLSRVFQLLADLEPGLKASAHPRYLFEAALVRMAGLGAVRPIEQVLEALGGNPSQPSKKKRTDVAGPAAATPAEPRQTAPPAAPPDATLAARIVEAVRPARPMLAAMIEQATEVRLGEGRLVIVFPADLQALQRQVGSSESLALLRREVEGIAGSPVGVLVELAPAAARPASAPTSRPSGPAASTGPAADLLDQARRDPGVQQLLDVFGAQVVDIRRDDRPTPRRPGGPAPAAEDDA
jgi:DNA polymerase-3 subunit gamma/tau